MPEKNDCPAARVAGPRHVASVVWGEPRTAQFDAKLHDLVNLSGRDRSIYPLSRVAMWGSRAESSAGSVFLRSACDTINKLS